MGTQRVALIGGAGFIGTHLTRHLQTLERYEPIVVDVNDQKLHLRCQEMPRFVECDISRDQALLDEIVQDVDVVFNLAAHVHPGMFIESPLDIVRLNVFHSLNVIDTCVRHGRRLIHFSTCEVYGKTGGSDLPFREDETDCILGPIVNHRWIYSNGKQLLDRIIHAHGLEGNLEYTLLRPFNFVGPLMDWLMPVRGVEHARVFAHFVSALMFGHPLQLVDGGHSRRSFTYIDDAVTAIGTILENRDASRNRIYNIGTPSNETTIRDLAHLMRDIYERETGKPADSPIVDVDAIEFYGPGYEDCDRRIPDISRLEALGWTPEFGLEETFTRSIRYCLEHRDELLSAGAVAV